MEGSRYYLKRDPASRSYLLISLVDGRPSEVLYPSSGAVVYDAFGVQELYLEGVLASMYVNNGRLDRLESIWSWADGVGLSSVEEKTVLLQCILDTAYLWIERDGHFKVSQDMVEDYVAKVFSHFREPIEEVLALVARGDAHILFLQDETPVIILSVFPYERVSIVGNFVESLGACNYSPKVLEDKGVVAVPYAISPVVFFNLMRRGYRFIPLGYDTLNLDYWVEYSSRNRDFVLKCAEVSFLYWSRVVCVEENFLMNDWYKYSRISLPSVPLSLRERRPHYSSDLSIRNVLETGVNRDELDILRKMLDSGYSYNGRVYLLGFREVSYIEKDVDEADVLVAFSIFRFDPRAGVLQHIDLTALQDILMDRVGSIKPENLWIKIDEEKYPSIVFCNLVVRYLDIIDSLERWEDCRVSDLPNYIKEALKRHLDESS